MDTGLSRNGVGAGGLSGDARPRCARALADDTVRVRGIMSHLAHGDDPDHPLNDLQAQRFNDMRAQARDAGVPFEVAHLCNSPAAMTRPDLAFDMVRPGIAVYGQTPIPERGDMGLRPAMTLKCPVAMVRPLKAGDGVSYGHTWIADRDTTRGADAARLRRRGVPHPERPHRRADQRPAAPGVGRICMDQFVVDLGPGPVDVAVGDDAILFGPGADGEPTAQDWADLLGTINYEVVTSPRGRIARIYRGEIGQSR